MVDRKDAIRDVGQVMFIPSKYADTDLTIKQILELEEQNPTIMTTEGEVMILLEEVKTMMYYYNVGIFYSRKDSFNKAIQTNIELDVDDLDEFANAVVELGLISKEDALQIVFAEEISEHEYEEMTC